jgi:hypothetical protein
VRCHGSQPGEKNTCTAAVSTRLWATWMTRAAVSARHHQRAAQAVCGSAQQARASGAAAASSTTAISRITYTMASTRASTTPASASRIKKIPPVEIELPSVVISDAAAVAGVTRCPASAADSPLAIVMAREMSTMDRFAARNPVTRRGAISLTE